MLQHTPLSPADRLASAGLRPTRQRLALTELVFGRGERHLSAEDLHAEAIRAKVPVSLATVYNTLRRFTDCGLLREVPERSISTPMVMPITISSSRPPAN